MDEDTMPTVDLWVEEDLYKLAKRIEAAARLNLRDITVTTTVKPKSGTLAIGAKYHLSAKKLTEGSRALRSTRTA